MNIRSLPISMARPAILFVFVLKVSTCHARPEGSRSKEGVNRTVLRTVLPLTTAMVPVLVDAISAMSASLLVSFVLWLKVYSLMVPLPLGRTLPITTLLPTIWVTPLADIRPTLIQRPYADLLASWEIVAVILVASELVESRTSTFPVLNVVGGAELDCIEKHATGLVCVPIPHVVEQAPHALTCKPQPPLAHA
jgi:hypothetical protein